MALSTMGEDEDKGLEDTMISSAKGSTVLGRSLSRNLRLSQQNLPNPLIPSSQHPTILFQQTQACAAPTTPQPSSLAAQSLVTHCPTLSTTHSTQPTPPPPQIWPGTPPPSTRTWPWSRKILTLVKSTPYPPPPTQGPTLQPLKFSTPTHL